MHNRAPTLWRINPYGMSNESPLHELSNDVSYVSVRQVQEKKSAKQVKYTVPATRKGSFLLFFNLLRSRKVLPPPWTRVTISWRPLSVIGEISFSRHNASVSANLKTMREIADLDMGSLLRRSFSTYARRIPTPVHKPNPYNTLIDICERRFVSGLPSRSNFTSKPSNANLPLLHHFTAISHLLLEIDDLISTLRISRDEKLCRNGLGQRNVVS